MRIGVMSDLHLGARQYGLEERELDFYFQYDQAIETLIQNKVDVVIIGGDLFDQPRPSPRALEFFTEGMKDLFAHNIKVFNIVGNHSMIQSKDFVTADDFLAKMPGFNDHYILLDSDSHFFANNDVAIYGLPYHYNFELDTFCEKVNALNQDAKDVDSDVKILVIHQAIKEYCGFEGENLSINDIEIDNFDLIVCGHIHDTKLTSITNKTIYLQPGSIERLSVKEARDEEVDGKGVFIFDTNNFTIENLSNGFIRIPNNRKFLIADMYIKDSKEIDDMKKEILDKTSQCIVLPILFLTVHDSSQSFAKLIDLTKDLKSDCLTVHFNYIDENLQEEVDLLTKDGDLLSPRKALKLALNPLEDDEAKLGLDLFDLLKDGHDATQLLEDFIKKKRQQKKVEVTRDYYDEELKEIFEYFGEE